MRKNNVRKNITNKRHQGKNGAKGEKMINGPLTILQGDARAILPTLPAELFQCCITSPPYWGLRDYQSSSQIGAETYVDDYVENLTLVFREVRRVLRENGTLWLNIGDSYTSGNRTWRDADDKNKGRAMSYRPPTPLGLKPKDLVGVPWRVAFALQADGWYLRSDIIWHKPNCQPESVKDRPTRSHEYIFLFSKSKAYFYDHAAIQDKAVITGGSKNKRTVWASTLDETLWNINTEPFNGAHFAVFPRALVRPCVLAGSRRGDYVIDPFLGSGTTAEVAVENGRNCFGIELKKEYIELAKNRTSQIGMKLNEVF